MQKFFLILIVLFTSNRSNAIETVESNVRITPTFIKHKFSAIDVELLVKNDTNEGIDFTRAIWKLSFNGVRGVIKQSEFDGFTVGPLDQRKAIVIFYFEKELPKEGTLEISIENIKNFKDAPVKPFKIQVVKGPFELKYDLEKVIYK